VRALGDGRGFGIGWCTYNIFLTSTQLFSKLIYQYNFKGENFSRAFTLPLRAATA